MSINRVNISGNLTRDPELRKTAAGLPVLGFGVAVSDRRKNPQTDQWEDYPNFVDCTMFGTRAESVARFLSKGSKVVVEGKLRWSSWERDGQKRSKLEVVVDELELLSRQDGAQPQYGQNANTYTPQQGNAPYAEPQTPQTAYRQPATQGQLVYDADIPF